jgi:glutathione S-transferase
MLTLFYSPGACSLASHIALEEIGTPFETVRTVIAEGATRTREYLSLNPRALVPTLKDDDFVLTESMAILLYLARRFPAAGLMPADPQLAARCTELLSVFTTSVHVAFRQLWRPERFVDGDPQRSAVRQGGLDRLPGWFDTLEGMVDGRSWAVGDTFTLCDTYLLVFYRWGVRVGTAENLFDMRRYPGWTRHTQRMLERPSVQRAMRRENILLG